MRKVKYYLIRIFLLLLIIEIGYVIYKKNKNNLPIAINDVYKVHSNMSTPLNVLINDLDSDNDSLEIKSIEGAKNGILENVGKTVIYTPNEGFSGIDSFRYCISDGRTVSEYASVKIEVVKEFVYYIEAEDFDLKEKNSPFIVKNNEKASGNKHLSVPNNYSQPLDSVPDEGGIVYYFELEEEGKVNIWLKSKGRYIAYWFKFDEEVHENCFYFGDASLWGWKGFKSELKLAKGKHKLQIQRRSVGGDIDIIILTNSEKSANQIEQLAMQAKKQT